MVCAIAYSGQSEKVVSWLHPGSEVAAEREAGGSERKSVIWSEKCHLESQTAP